MASSSSFPGKMEFNCERKPHVLAVDDDDVARRVTEKLLINSACKVTTAENGEEALEFLQSLKVNMIITDYHMPGISGCELVKKIKALPNMKEIPVVIVSSDGRAGPKDECLAVGANGFFKKPLQQSDFNKIRLHMT